MHIGLFIKDFAVGKKFNKNGMPFRSGAEFHGENHARQLMKRGHSISIFAKKKFYFTKARENLSGIDLVRLHAPFRGLEVIFRMMTSHRDIDAIYILGKPKFAVWAIMMARWLHIPVTLALTGSSELFNDGDSWRRKIFTNCNHYIALSQEIKRGLMQQSAIAEERIIVLNQGISTSKYAVPTKEYKASLRERFNIDKEAPVLLFCARIAINKGIDTLLKIWPEIHRQLPNAIFCVVGGGQNELLDSLREMGNKTGGSVLVVGETDQTLEYYQMSDVYIFPSRHEGCPTTLMEAMSCGLPAVVSDIGGCEDLVKSDVSGYRIHSEDVEGFVSNAVRLLEDTQLRERMGASAAEFIHATCDYSNIIWRLDEVITSAKKE